MQADSTAQARLLDLVSIDRRLLQLAHQRKTLPQTQQISELHAQFQSLGDRVVELEAKLSDAQGEVDRVEDDLTTARARLDRDTKRAHGGEVTDSRALQGVLDEIEHLTGRIATLEDQELEHLQILEDLGAERDAVVAQRAEVSARARDLIAERNEQLAEIKMDSDLTEQSRRGTAADLPADLLALYDKIAQRSGGIGAAELRARRCTGCGLEVNAADLRRYAAAPASEVLRCEECDRILVRTAESGLPQ